MKAGQMRRILEHLNDDDPVHIYPSQGGGKHIITGGFAKPDVGALFYTVSDSLSDYRPKRGYAGWSRLDHRWGHNDA